MRVSQALSTVFQCVSVALGLLCASASLVADGPGLVDAARNGNLDSVRSLLKSGADPNQAAPDGSTAVHWAVHGDNLAMLNALLDAGAKPNSVTRYRIAPLTLAAQNGNAVLVERLLDAGANPDTASEEGQTALMTAARNGSVAAVRALLKRGAQVGLTESFRGQTALMFAAGEGNADAATLLPDSTVVGAFHHLSAVLLEDLSRPTLDGDVMVVGDVREATDVVQALAGRLPGMRGIYAGRLRNARQVEALRANLVAVDSHYEVNAGVRITDV